MKKEERTYIQFLEDIVLSISRVQEYIADLDFQHFKWDYKTVDAVIRNFEIIGEAAKNLPDELKDNNQQVPWKEMYRMRNRISHDYFGIDYEIIWAIATNELPQNKADIEWLLNNEKDKVKTY